MAEMCLVDLTVSCRLDDYGRDVSCGPDYGRDVSCGPDYGRDVFCGPDYGRDVSCGPDYGRDVSCGPDYGRDVSCGPDYGKMCLVDLTIASWSVSCMLSMKLLVTLPLPTPTPNHEFLLKSPDILDLDSKVFCTESKHPVSCIDLHTHKILRVL